jgi:hypothetical protein
MVCPNKERCLSEKRRLKIQISKLDKNNIPVELSNRLKAINKRLSEIEQIQKETDPTNGGLHFVENAVRGD